MNTEVEKWSANNRIFYSLGTEVQQDQQMMKSNQRDKRKPENYIVTEGKEERFLSFSKAAERKKENATRKRLLNFQSSTNM